VRFTEINLPGVFVAPMSLMMVVAWIVAIGLRRIAARFGLLRDVWHPAMFVFAVYMIVVSTIVLTVAAPTKATQRSPKPNINRLRPISTKRG
jgi:protein AaeX